jgi:hypothetical protein
MYGSKSILIFEVVIVTVKITVCRDVMLCSLVHSY